MQEKIVHRGIADLVSSFLVVKTKSVASEFARVSWEMLDLQKHLSLINQWVHLPYSKEFWQMDHLSFDELHQHYAQILDGSNSTSLIGHFDNKPICQIELYDCNHDEINHYYEVKPGDVGLHFLMAPQTISKIHGISLLMMRSVLQLLLSNPHITRVMGEPDVRNQKANSLVSKAGFRFLKQIEMSYKQANLYECTRDTFF